MDWREGSNRSRSLKEEGIEEEKEGWKRRRNKKIIEKQMKQTYVRQSAHFLHRTVEQAIEGRAESVVPIELVLHERMVDWIDALRGISRRNEGAEVRILCECARAVGVDNGAEDVTAGDRGMGRECIAEREERVLSP